MSDYLQRLAEAAVSAPAAIRPALPSLFEPLPTGGALATGFTAPEHDAEPMGHAGVTPQSVPDRVASVQAIWTAASSPATRPPPAAPLPVRGEEPPVRESAAVSPATVESMADSVDSSPAIAPRLFHPSEPAQGQPLREASQPAALSTEGAKATPLSPHPTQGAPVEHRGLPHVATVPRAPMAGRQRARADSAAAADPGSSPPPAIHVTIGRVEVRAILPAAPAPTPPARPAPKMSLDDFLRARNGGAA